MASWRYQLVDRNFLFDWLSQLSDPTQREILLDWLVEFSADPLERAERVPGTLAAVFVIEAPLRPPVMVRFLLDEVNHAVKFINRRPLP